MDFRLTKPCHNCPFRREGGIRLTPARAREIARGQTDSQGLVFPCHKTVNYDEYDGDEEYTPQKGNQYCAGALNFALNSGALNQLMRIAARIGLWKPDAMRERDACFKNEREMVAAQRKQR